MSLGTKNRESMLATQSRELFRLKERIRELESAAIIPPSVTIHAMHHDPANLYGISPEDWTKCGVHLRAQHYRIKDNEIQITRMTETIRFLRSTLLRCAAHAGLPDPATGCRAIIATVKDALAIP